MSKLPVWFNLNDYTQELTVEQWALEIAVRNIFFSNAREDFVGGADQFLENVICKDSRLRKREGSSLAKALDEPENPDPLLVININDLSENIASNKARVETHRFFLTEVYKRHDAIIPFMRHTDKELIDSFKKYLKERRKSEYEPSKFPNGILAELPDWQKFRLLALFDLLLWKKLAQPKLKYEIIGDAIWPENRLEGLDVAQRIRKKGKPLIRDVFKHFVPYQMLHEAKRR